MTHPTRGTCNDTACDSHGWCHCGCGNRALVASREGHRSRGETPGMPRIWRRGHNGSIYKAQRECTKNGIPIERVRPLLLWLLERYTWREVRFLTGGVITGGHITRLLGRGQRPMLTVRRATAERLIAAVQASRPPTWRSIDEEPMASDRARPLRRSDIPDPDRRKNAEDKRRSREKAREAAA